MISFQTRCFESKGGEYYGSDGIKDRNHYQHGTV